MAEGYEPASSVFKHEDGDDSGAVEEFDAMDDISPDREVQEVLRYQLVGASREATGGDKSMTERRE